MRFGVCGLGRMGANLALQAIEKGHEVVGFDTKCSDELEGAGATVVDSVAALTQQLEPPRVALSYVPHGEPTEQVISDLAEAFDDGDVVVDGGNTHWNDSIRRYGVLAQRGVRFLDAGTSGGVTGARHGACFMVGGDSDAYEVVRPILEDLAVPDGALHVGPPGSGHFAKKVHNMIEFGMVQAIGRRRRDAEALRLEPGPGRHLPQLVQRLGDPGLVGRAHGEGVAVEARHGTPRGLR
jgi:6-phosphogluconate dehydrogenase